MRRSTAIRSQVTAGAVLVVAILAASAFGPYLLGPRTRGLSGQWSAPSTDGDVRAGRALVSGGNAALDLRTGKSVRLGSVAGGTAFYGDDRLVVVSGERVDSARLDATVRWTWRAEAGHTVTPLAAAGGSTLVADCPAGDADRCRLVGINPEGKQDWVAADAGKPVDPPRATLPRVHARRVDGGGVLITDPVSGRSSLQPGSAFTALPDGPVVVSAQQAGQCVVSLHASPDPLWTRVLGVCPGGALPDVSGSASAVVLTWPGRTESLTTATGATATPSTGPTILGVLARAGSLVATQGDQTPSSYDIVRRGRNSHVLEVRDARSGDLRARLVTYDPLTLLALEPAALVVRQGDQVVRYTVDD